MIAGAPDRVLHATDHTALADTLSGRVATIIKQQCITSSTTKTTVTTTTATPIPAKKTTLVTPMPTKKMMPKTATTLKTNTIITATMETTVRTSTPMPTSTMSATTNAPTDKPRTITSAGVFTNKKKSATPGAATAVDDVTGHPCLVDMGQWSNVLAPVVDMGQCITLSNRCV